MKPLLYSFFLCLTFIACNNKNRNTGTGTPAISDNFTEAATSPHRPHHEKYDDFNFSSEAEWDSLVGNKPHPIPALRHELHPDYKTFGWHLYSKGSAYKSYNFSLLWGISYFSYIVDPETGGYKSIHQWKTTALVDSARVHHTKVFLSVSNFGSRDNATFLSHEKARETLLDSLAVLLDLRAANGINIDFEGVVSKSRTAFNDFIVFASKKLKQYNPEYQVSLALYAVDYNKVFDIKRIDPHIDFYTLMSYDYYGGFSEDAGPVAPLTSSKIWGEYSVESSVDYYLKEGISPGKLIVGIPYYGAEWSVKNAILPGKAEKFLSHPTYSGIKHDYINRLRAEIRHDTSIASNYLTMKDESGALRQLWFNDSLSFARRYDWVKRKKLSGVGIWALGYDHGDPELWELLAAKFGQEK